MPDQFIPDEKAWINSHYYDVPQQTIAFSGSITGATLLNLGCGEMLTDFGLLNCNVKKIVGLDLDAKPSGHLATVARKLQNHGIEPPRDYEERIAYRHYDGTRFPFEDRSFDFVFSWSAFEHVRSVLDVLAEVRRVLSDDGSAFIQVYPWYQSFAGSHLSDYISEPYFHLTRDAGWIRQELERYVLQHPDKRDFILNYMFGEYRNLNRYSADSFYEDVLAAGFRVAKAAVISFDLDLSEAPVFADFSALMICGTKMLLKKRLSPVNDGSLVPRLARQLEDRTRQVEQLHNSLSWRLTAPLRLVGAHMARASARLRRK